MGIKSESEGGREGKKKKGTEREGGREARRERGEAVSRLWCCCIKVSNDRVRSSILQV